MSVTPPKREASVDSDESIAKHSLESDTTSAVVDDLVDAEPEPFKLYNYLFRRHLYSSRDLDAIATRRSVYDDPHLGAHYWPKPEYENIHRFDVKARWTAREERVSSLQYTSALWSDSKEKFLLQNLVRKIDWKVMLWAAISFSALNLDRNNLSQANSDNFLKDLNLTTNGEYLSTLETTVAGPLIYQMRLQLGQYRFSTCLSLGRASFSIGVEACEYLTILRSFPRQLMFCSSVQIAGSQCKCVLGRYWP